MSENNIILLVGVFFVIFSVLALCYINREYRTRNKLSGFGAILHLLIFFVNGMFVGMSIWGPIGIPPMTGLTWLGVPLMVFGLGIVVYAMDWLQNFSRWLGNKTPGLKTNGLYQLSRNPQFVGYALLILGMVIAWGKLFGWVGLLSYLILAYWVVRIEEEHLKRVYGKAYYDYCTRVPRFIPNFYFGYFSK